MYLACTVRTMDDQKHESKFILPKGTQAIEKAPKHGNIRDRFNFSNCDPDHSFDAKEQIVYMKITDDEHASGKKKYAFIIGALLLITYFRQGSQYT